MSLHLPRVILIKRHNSLSVVLAQNLWVVIKQDLDLLSPHETLLWQTGDQNS